MSSYFASFASGKICVISWLVGWMVKLLVIMPLSLEPLTFPVSSHAHWRSCAALVFVLSRTSLDWGDSRGSGSHELLLKLLNWCQPSVYSVAPSARAVRGLFRWLGLRWACRGGGSCRRGSLLLTFLHCFFLLFRGSFCFNVVPLACCLWRVSCSSSSRTDVDSYNCTVFFLLLYGRGIAVFGFLRWCARVSLLLPAVSSLPLSWCYWAWVSRVDHNHRMVTTFSVLGHRRLIVSHNLVFRGAILSRNMKTVSHFIHHGFLLKEGACFRRGSEFSNLLNLPHKQSFSLDKHRSLQLHSDKFTKLLCVQSYVVVLPVVYFCVVAYQINVGQELLSNIRHEC